VSTTDVFVIGGGPAGLAVAIAARLRGLKVMVADGSELPIDKPCGEGLMPDGLTALQQLGVSIPQEESFAFQGIRFLSGGLKADAAFPDGAFGMGVRRTVLHRVIAEQAQRMGIDILWRTTVTAISPDGVHLGRHKIRAKWIVGSDGANSRARRWAGLDRFRDRIKRYAYRQHFHIKPWTDGMELHWGRRGEIYVTPVSSEQVCVALISRDPKLRLAEALQQLPELQARLQGVDAASAEKGAVTSTSRLKRVSRGNVALIGDASGSVDAITGEGLCLAFHQAKILAECLEGGDLSRYEKEHRLLALRPRLMARLMLVLDRRPRLQRRVVQAFGRHPSVFQRLLELHVGVLSPLHLALDGLTLGWGLLTA